MDAIVFQTSPTKWIALMIGSLAFVALGLWLALSGSSVVIGWINVAFFGACSVIYIRHLADRRPRIVVDECGVTDNLLGVGCIEWADVVGAELRFVRGSPILSLELRDPSKYVIRLSPFMRRMTAANKVLGFTEISLSLVGLASDPTAVARVIIERVERRSLSRCSEER
jgi:hypothetical protein